MIRFVRYTVCQATMLAALTFAFVAVPVAAADPATARAASTADTKTLMADARRAVQAGKLIAPAGDNAFEYYVAIRRIDVTDTGAHEGIVDLYPLMADATDAALDRGNWNEAARLLVLIEAGVPASRLAPRFRQRLEAAGVRVPLTTAVAMAPR
jgi:protein TonB